MSTYTKIGACLSAAIIGASVFVASPAAALTAEEIRTQIQELLAKVAELQEQLRIVTEQPTSSDPALTPPAYKHRVCSALVRNLSQGIEGEDVRGLQEFLSSQGHFSGNATGYFGPMTARAVAQWQASEGVQSIGSFGPLSRERLRIWCGGGGGGVACTAEYRPVCGQKQVVCITTPCNPVQQTYGNVCTARADSATVLYEGQCRNDSTHPKDDPQCKSWNDGKWCGSTCYRSTPGGEFNCVSPMCERPSGPIPPERAPYCSERFDHQCPSLPPYSPCPAGTTAEWKHDSNGCKVSSQCVSSGNKPPVIRSFSGPTTLSVHQSGTWTIQASDPENQSLSYTVTWGDEYANNLSIALRAPLSFVQSSSLTHSYASAGTYQIRIIVRDASGQEAETSITVRVGGEPVACTMEAKQCPDGSFVGRTGPRCEFAPCPTPSACTMEYAPVCGQPPEPACRYSVPACLLPAQSPQTYGNRCVMNAAGATFLYSGECR